MLRGAQLPRLLALRISTLSRGFTLALQSSFPTRPLRERPPEGRSPQLFTPMSILEIRKRVMKTFEKSLADEQGMILVISLMILTLLLGAGVGAIVSMQTDLRTSSNLKTGKQAFYIADAGANRAWKELDDGNGTNDFDSLSGSVTLYSNVSYASGSYTVTAEVQHPGSSTQPIIPKRVKVTSTGCYPAVTGTGSFPARSAKVVIEAQFRRESLFNCAACGKDSVSITGGSTTNSYDSRTGAYGGSNVGSDGDVGSNGTITLSGTGAIVHGDASALSSVTATGGALVDGTTTNLKAPIE